MIHAARRLLRFFSLGHGIVLLLAILQAGCARTGAPEQHHDGPASTQPVKHVRVLVVGNSFSYDATGHLPGIVEAAGHEITLFHASLGGCSLERHWRHAAAFEADPDDPQGRPYGPADGKYSLREALQRQPWDIVTLQQFSNHSYRPETYHPYARQLRDYIQQHAPQAEVVIHQTWAYESDDPMFADGRMTQRQMYEGLRSAYGAIAKELGLRQLPVGDAMQLARQDPAWQVGPRDPGYDFENPTYPNLPQQPPRLTVGYVWRKDKSGQQALVLDAHHASLAGDYLGAAVWFETLYGQSVIGNSYVPEGMTEEQVSQLQAVAHRAVADLQGDAVTR